MSVEEIRLRSWSEFEKLALETVDEVEEMRRTYVDRVKSYKPGELVGKSNLPLFRGQSNATWRLETTLEREFGQSQISLYRYYRFLQRIKPALESFTGKQWDLEVHNYFDQDSMHHLDSYEFLVFLRQYGFPSPLLDWTHSPYVAAYFAYSSCKGTDVAIYTYVRGYHTSMRVLGAGELDSNCGGRFVCGTPRHFLQQSDYTFCRYYVVFAQSPSCPRFSRQRRLSA